MRALEGEVTGSATGASGAHAVRRPPASGRGARAGWVRLACIVALTAAGALAAGCSEDGGETGSSTTGPSTPSTVIEPGTAPVAAPGPTRVEVLGTTVEDRADADAEAARAARPVRMTVSAAPAEGPAIAVEIVETDTHGTGPQWRAACWTAALNAVSLLDLPPGDLRLTYEVDGPADASSTAGPLTVATLAALLGDTLRPDVAVAAGVNPDGGIAPVDGLVQRLEAAPASGARLVLLPAGQAVAADPRTGDPVDLAARAAQLFVDVAPVRTVAEAYQFMTGRPLPGPAGGATPPPLGDDSRAALERARERWVAWATELAAAYAEVAEAGRDDYTDGLAAASESWTERSDQDLLRGDVAGAYGSSQKAVFDAGLALVFATMRSSPADGAGERVTAALGRIGPLADRDALRSRLLATSPATSGQADGLVSAWGHMILAEGLTAEADTLLAALPADATEGAAANAAVFDYAYALQHLYAAADELELASEAGGAAIAGVGQAPAAADAYLQAARADLDLMAAVAVPRFAKETRISHEAAQAKLAVFDNYYGAARAIVAGTDALAEDLPAGPARDYALLGGALAAYSSAATAVAENIAYQAGYDGGGTISGFAHDESLAEGLTVAADRSGSAIVAADPDGAGTLLPHVWRDWGVADRDGDPGHRMTALHDFWKAAVQARTLGLLAGTLEPLATLEGR